MGKLVRFAHAADLHLDAPFVGIDASDDRVRRELADSTYTALDRLVDLCVDRDVDFLVLAGDIYNSADKSLRAQFAFRRAVRKLSEQGIPVLVVQGNHDPADGWATELELPETITFFPTNAVGRVDMECGGAAVSVFGQGFATRAVKENLAEGFKRDHECDVAIGLLHTNVGGRTEHEPYAPSSTDDLRAAGMDYWALGHVHTPGRVCDDPVAVYAGTPQGLNPKERGAHGCYIVEIEAGVVTEEFCALDSIRWASIEIAGEEFDSIDSLRAALIRRCIDARGEQDRPLVVRADLTGPSEVHSVLVRPGALADLVENVRDELLDERPWIFLDRLRDLTSPAVDIDRLREGGGFAADLVMLAEEILADPAATAEMFDEVMAPIRERAQHVDPGIHPADALKRARDLCLERLLAQEDA